MLIDDISAKILGRASKLQTALGTALLESAYHRCLAYDFETAGLRVASELTVPMVDDGFKIDAACRVDFPVEKTLLVEFRPVERFALSPLW